MKIEYTYQCNAHGLVNYLAGGIWCCPKIFKILKDNYTDIDFPIYYIEEKGEFAFVSSQTYECYKEGKSVFENNKLFYVCRMCFLLSNAITKILWPLQKDKIINDALNKAAEPEGCDNRTLRNILKMKVKTNSEAELLVTTDDYQIHFFYQNSFTLYKNNDGFSYYIPYKNSSIHGIVISRFNEITTSKAYFNKGECILKQHFTDQGFMYKEEFLEATNYYAEPDPDFENSGTIVHNEEESIFINIDNEIQYILSSDATHCVKYKNGSVIQTFDYKAEEYGQVFKIVQSEVFDENSKLKVKMTWDKNRQCECRNNQNELVDCRIYFDPDLQDEIFNHVSIYSCEL